MLINQICDITRFEQWESDQHVHQEAEQNLANIAVFQRFFSL